jgi:hypothetical protein
MIEAATVILQWILTVQRQQLVAEYTHITSNHTMNGTATNAHLLWV